MIEAAEFVQENYMAAAATMRRHYGCSVNEFGTASLTWREAYALILDAIDDSATSLGAHVREWSFRVSQAEHGIMRALVGLLSHGDTKAASKNEKALLPDVRKPDKRVESSVTSDEYAEATESLLAQFGIDPSIAAADIAAAKAKL